MKLLAGIFTPKNKGSAGIRTHNLRICFKNGKKFQDKSGLVLKSPKISRIFGPTVERSLAIPRAMGSNPGRSFVF